MPSDDNTGHPSSPKELEALLAGLNGGDGIFQKCCDTLAPGGAKWYPLFQPQPGGCCGWSRAPDVAP